MAVGAQTSMSPMAGVEQSGSVALAMLLMRFVLDRVNISIASLNCRLVHVLFVLHADYTDSKDRSDYGHWASEQFGSRVF